MKILTTIYALVFLSLTSLPALAATTVPCYDNQGVEIPCNGGGTVPEPGALALLAIGAGAAALVWSRRRNKK